MPAMTASNNDAEDAGNITALSSVDDSRLETGELREEEWTAGKEEYGVMITMAVISLMVALDATILVSVLPVSSSSSSISCLESH